MPPRHPPEVRAAAVAAVAAGEALSEVARRYGISKGRLSEWYAVDGPDLAAVPERSGTLNARTRERMAELIYDCIADIFGSVRTQLRAASDEEWLASQNAADVAAILDREIDGAIRLLAGFRPAADDPVDGHVVPPAPEAEDFP